MILKEMIVTDADGKTKTVAEYLTGTCIKSDDVYSFFAIKNVNPPFSKPPAPDPAMVADAEATIARVQAEYQQMRAQVDPDSPIFKAADSIKAQLMAVRQETLDTIHAVIPPKVPEHEAKVRDNALQAAYRWIVSPDEVNAKKALDVGNECPDTPAGLLALCAFWAGGNLMPDPEKDQVVPTPNGLAANGLSQVLLMCALHKGGTRKLKERYEHYFNLGVEVLTGKNNWDKSVVEGEAPHDAEKGAPSEPEKTADEKQDEKSKTFVYKRWKPKKGLNNDFTGNDCYGRRRKNCANRQKGREEYRRKPDRPSYPMRGYVFLLRD